MDLGDKIEKYLFLLDDFGHVCLFGGIETGEIHDSKTEVVGPKPWCKPSRGFLRIFIELEPGLLDGLSTRKAIADVLASRIESYR